MLDIKFVRDNPETVKENIRKIIRFHDSYIFAFSNCKTLIH